MGVIRISDFPWSAIACLYSSQPGAHRLGTEVVDEGLGGFGHVEHPNCAPYTCTQCPSKSSERMQMLTSGSRWVLLVFARCGYVDTTMRRSRSTLQLTGES